MKDTHINPFVLMREEKLSLENAIDTALGAFSGVLADIGEAYGVNVRLIIDSIETDEIDKSKLN